VCRSIERKALRDVEVVEHFRSSRGRDDLIATLGELHRGGSPDAGRTAGDECAGHGNLLVERPTVSTWPGECEQVRDALPPAGLLEPVGSARLTASAVSGGMSWRR